MDGILFSPVEFGSAKKTHCSTKHNIFFQRRREIIQHESINAREFFKILGNINSCPFRENGRLSAHYNFLNGLSLSEDAKNIYVEAAVPNVDAQDIDVTFSRGMLTTKAKKKEEEKGKTFQRKATSSFFYKISLGYIDPKKEPSATFKNGVMTVAFAKLTGKQLKKLLLKPRELVIKVSSRKRMKQ